MSNNFEENYLFGVKKYRHLLEKVYQHICYDGRYVCINNSPFSDLIQQKLKTDSVIQKEAEVSYGVEEKVVAWPEEKGHPYTAFFLETRSCTNPGHESRGWMFTSQADRLLYAFEIKDLGLVVYLLDFPRLQQWFRKNYLPHLPRPDFGLCTMRDENRTEGRLVAIAMVIKYVPTDCFLVTFEGECKPLPPGVNIQGLREAYVQQQKNHQEKLLFSKHDEEESAEARSSDATSMP